MKIFSIKLANTNKRELNKNCVEFFFIYVILGDTKGKGEMIMNTFKNVKEEEKKVFAISKG